MIFGSSFLWYSYSYLIFVLQIKEAKLFQLLLHFLLLIHILLLFFIIFFFFLPLLLLLLLLLFEIFPTQHSRAWIEREMENFLKFSWHSSAGHGSMVKWKTFRNYSAVPTWENFKNFKNCSAALHGQILKKSRSFSLCNVDWTPYAGRGRSLTPAGRDRIKMPGFFS